MRLVPIGTNPYFRQQRHFECRHPGHQRGDFSADPFHLCFGHLKYQFIVHLHDHLGGLILRIQHLLHFGRLVAHPAVRAVLARSERVEAVLGDPAVLEGVSADARRW